MFWNLNIEKTVAPQEAPHDGRFVLHRHHDAEGAHFDLRLEHPDGYLLGWRAAATSDHGFTGSLCASTKAPHPIHWLEQDGDAVREDAGLYTWLDRDPDHGTLLLQGRDGQHLVHLRREAGLAPEHERAIIEAARRVHAAPADLPRLVEDGVTARRRAIERLCGLGRELDGPAFDEALWRRTVAGLTLEELGTHLRGFELRFDQKYPPQPVSRPEALDTPANDTRTARVMEILRG